MCICVCCNAQTVLQWLVTLCITVHQKKQGSDVRRRAVEVLGEVVHSRMRTANALPSSTLVVAALQLASTDCPG